MRGLANRLARRLNWARRRWSTERDRAFHDSLFAGQAHDPFTASYPGYVTIRRFADLAARHIRAGDRVFDLGCGPGEITCELARRRPDCQFVAVDHSEEAIARGRQLAAGLGLPNICFELGDLERYVPERASLVTMFDAFHHVLDPGGLIKRSGRSTDRFFLIEPAGNAIGQWQRTADLDWLAEALFVIRDRLEYQFDLAPAAKSGPPAGPRAGEPTERRYSLDDFSRLFAGHGLDVHGTVAGLERYGTPPFADTPIRDGIGGVVYRLVVEIEETLRRVDLDLAAKHWAIYAERGGTFPARQIPRLPHRAIEQPLAGPYDAEYASFEGPTEARPGSVVDATVRVVNRSWRVWDSAASGAPIVLSYHWLDRTGGMLVEDGLRSPLPRPVAPGESATVAFRVRCPDRPGRYTLAIDLVHENVTWFSQAGVPPLHRAWRVV